MSNRHTAKQIFAKMLDAEHILLIPHRHPDGDALGALGAMASYLQDAEKKHSIFCVTNYSKKLSYVPGVTHFSTDPTIWKDPTIDMIVVFDSGDLRYAGVDEYINSMPKKPIIVNIDHHVTNEDYGQYNLVRKGASSTSEILYHFFVLNEVAISGPMATSLLTGIITDTDNFTNSATTPSAIEAAGHLVNLGGEFDVIKKHVYKSTSLNAFKLWGHIFSRLTHHKPLNIVYTYITQHDMEKHDLSDDDVEGITNFLNAISEGHAGLILKEHPDGEIKGSFRTTRNDVDVSKMAKHFGGGGHKKAAGFTVDGPIESAVKHVLAELEALFPHGSVLETAQAKG
jgi:bifunctional oligoribonuclease and PAP phosphatase NrnA